MYDALLAASGRDRFVAAELDPTVHFRGYAVDGATGWIGERRGGRRSWLTIVGKIEPAAALAARTVEEARAGTGRPPYGLTAPRGVLDLLPLHVRPEGTTADWDWFWTDTAPPAQPAELSVGWLRGTSDAQLRAFLHISSDRYSAEPGAPDVRAWCGVRDTSGRLLAVAAHTEHVPGVPHLASIATRPDQRGRGYGAAVTAWLTRSLLPAHGWVTLGMYADNAGARSIYLRLGYRNEHRFTSGRFAAC